MSPKRCLGMAALLLGATAAHAAGEITGVLDSARSSEMQWQNAYLMAEPAPDSRVVSQMQRGTSIVIHPERSTDQYYFVDFSTAAGTVQGFVWREFVRPSSPVKPVTDAKPASSPESTKETATSSAEDSPQKSSTQLSLRMISSAPTSGNAESTEPAPDIPPGTNVHHKSSKKNHKSKKVPAAPSAEARGDDPQDQPAGVYKAGAAVVEQPLKELRALRGKLEAELEALPQGKMDKSSMTQMDHLVTCLNDVLELERATTKVFEGTSLAIANHQQAIAELQEKVARLDEHSGGGDSGSGSGDLAAQVSQLRKTVLDLSVRVADGRAQAGKIHALENALHKGASSVTVVADGDGDARLRGMEKKLAKLERIVKQLENPTDNDIADKTPDPDAAAPVSHRAHHHQYASKSSSADDSSSDRRAEPLQEAGLTSSQGAGSTNVADIAVGDAKNSSAPAPVDVATKIQPLPQESPAPEGTRLTQSQIQARLAHLLEIVRSHQAQAKAALAQNNAGVASSPALASKNSPDAQDDSRPSDRKGVVGTDTPPARPATHRSNSDDSAGSDDDGNSTNSTTPAASGQASDGTSGQNRNMSINQIEKIMNSRL